MGKLRGGSVHRLLVKNGSQEGMLTENTTQETVHSAIFDNIHWKRFFLAEEAPICSGPLSVIGHGIGGKVIPAKMVQLAESQSL